MSVPKPFVLLAVLTLALVWGLPVQAEISSAPLCLGGSSPTAQPALGSPDSVAAQTCGPCVLEFCGKIGVRCTFTDCGITNCCRYTCVCDLSCTTASSPGNTCRFLIPNNCLCGNGVADMDEDCDGADLRGETCVSRGFDGGTLACNGNCIFDTSGCFVCGNGNQETGEDCDGFDLGGETCVSQGFDGGTLACTSSCGFDTTDCYKCGNGTCEGPEDCESCPADCDSQTTGNPSQRFCCGNGTAESAEGMSCSVCDGNC